MSADREPQPGQNGDPLQEVLGKPELVPPIPLHKQYLVEFHEARQHKVKTGDDSKLKEFREQAPRYEEQDPTITETLAEQIAIIRDATIPKSEMKPVSKDAMIVYSESDRR